MKRRKIRTERPTLEDPAIESVSDQGEVVWRLPGGWRMTVRVAPESAPHLRRLAAD